MNTRIHRAPAHRRPRWIAVFTPVFPDETPNPSHRTTRNRPPARDEYPNPSHPTTRNRPPARDEYPNPSHRTARDRTRHLAIESLCALGGLSHSGENRSDECFDFGGETVNVRRALIDGRWHGRRRLVAVTAIVPAAVAQTTSTAGTTSTTSTAGTTSTVGIAAAGRAAATASCPWVSSTAPI